MPSLAMPRIGLGSIARPSGITVPGVASGIDVAGRHVERAAPHVALDAVAGVDEHPVDLGRVGVALGAQHSRGDDAAHGGAHTVRHPRPRGRDGVMAVGDGVDVVADRGRDR